MIPSLEYRRTFTRNPRPISRGLDAWADRFIGQYHSRKKVFDALSEQAYRISKGLESLTSIDTPTLQSQLHTFQKLFRRRKKIEEADLEAAVMHVVIAAHRRYGLLAHPVQIMGLLAIQKNFLAEMATGEGKTLTIGLAAVLAGWTGLPCHVITANDYLAERDAQWLTPFYNDCGLTVGSVTGSMSPDERKVNYARSLVYTTSKELLADFLRDRLKLGAYYDPARRLLRKFVSPDSTSEDIVLQGLHTAIVDEADNVLIDEAVTPLIISQIQKNEMFAESCQVAHEIASQLQSNLDYQVDHQFRDIRFTPEGVRKIDERCGPLHEIWRSASRRTELIQQSLVAREFFHRGQQYVIEEKKIVIVDEFTGRMMPQRTWRQGLHQAIEAKEGLEITHPTETLASLSFQRFFRLFHKLSGISGTAREAARELWHIYHLPVISIPTHRPCVRKEQEDKIFPTSASKWQAVIDEVLQVSQTGRPLLIGTRSVSDSQRLAQELEKRGLKHQLLNAILHKEEAGIIAKAGERGQITIATNMAGRGTDIKLGTGVRELGGLHVIATERHESRRIDRQLFGRAGRQGDPGSSQTFVSLEDEILVRFVPTVVRNRMATELLKKRQSALKIARSLFVYGQKKAEQQAYLQRKAILEVDTWLEDSLSFSTDGRLL
jgi:preprotein translocase subunit SecA